MSVIAIKLEMAELSLKANRIEEAEKTIMDVILDPTTDSDSQYSAFIALGSIKMIRLLKNTAIFSEVEYCYKKAYAIKPNELTVDAYLLTLSYFLKTSTEAIETSKKNIKVLQIKAGIDLAVTIGSAYILNHRGNSLLTNVVGLIGLDYGVNGVIGDINTIDGYNQIIGYLNKCILEVIENYNTSLPVNELQVINFEDEIGKNNLRKLLSADRKDNKELLFEMFDEAKSLDINFRMIDKELIKPFAESPKIKFSSSAVMTHLVYEQSILLKYFNLESEKIYFTFKVNNKEEHSIIFDDNCIQIITTIKKHEVFNYIKIDYSDFFNSRLVLPSEKDVQIINFIFPNTQLEYGLISFDFPFKSSTRIKQIEMVKKIAGLFQ
jgi:hypothetical protein